MATADILFPPSNHVLPGSIPLPTAPFPDASRDESSNSESIPPESIVSEWLLEFKQLLSKSQGSSSHLFLKESCWRDLLFMTWDFRTIQGPELTSHFIQSNLEAARALNVHLDKAAAHKEPQLADLGGLTVIQACLKVENGAGRGEGVVRLAQDSADSGRWKVFTLFTTLRELKGHEERVQSRRPTGHNDDNIGNESSNWKDRLVAQQNFEGGREPTVLIIGKLRERLQTVSAADSVLFSKVLDKVDLLLQQD